MKKIILIGGIGTDTSFVGGEHSKNMHLISALQDCGRIVVPADLADLRKHPWKGFRALWVLFKHPNANVIISSSLRRAGWLIKWLHILDSRRNICFVGTGREFSKKIADGVFSAKYFRNVRSIIVQGEKMKTELESVGLHAIVLPNFKHIEYLPDLSNKERGIARFAFLSRMQKEKGVNLIIQSINKLNSDGLGNEFTVDFYGLFEDPEYKKEVFDSIKEMSNVHYEGVLDLRKSIGYDRLANHTAMLFPTFWPGEGFPGIIIDALIAGLPMIASDWHFNSDYIEMGKTGVIIPNQDLRALYDAMSDVIKHPQKYEQMSEYCQQQAMKYNTKNIINEDFLTMINM